MAGDLINNDKVDIVTAASTPDTVVPGGRHVRSQRRAVHHQRLPVAAVRRQPLAAASWTTVFKWTYHTFWGLEDVQANFLDMWGQVETNKKVAAMFPNDADGNAWLPGWDNVWGPAGLTPTIPSQFQTGTEDFSSQLGRLQEGRL